MSEQDIIIAAEGVASAPTKRFVRNKDVPLEKERIRERMISARVMNGLTAVEASKRMGYGNSTQISQIESGERKVPNDFQFFIVMSDAYSVSIDYLLGLSKNPERDAIAAESFALLRGFEELHHAQAVAMTTAFIKYGTERQINRVDILGATGAMERVIGALNKMRELCPEFDDLRGGASLVAAMEKLEGSFIPLKETMNRRIANEQHMIDIATGKRGALSTYIMNEQLGFGFGA